MGCTRTMTQCMFLHAPDQGFPNSVEGWGEIYPSGGEWEILLKESSFTWWWEPEEVTV